MALSPSAYATLLEQKIRANSFRGRAVGGYYLSEFCQAVGYGVVTEAISLTGQIAAPSNIGASFGTGIVGMSADNIASVIETVCENSWGSKGPLLHMFCLSIGQATVEHFALATLTSDANGAAKFASFAGGISGMAGLIQSHPRWAGRPYWIKMCNAIATGICAEVAANGTGSLSGAGGIPTGSGVVAIS